MISAVAVGRLALALVSLGEPVPATLHVEGETALAFVQAETPIGRVEVRWRGAAGAVRTLEASEDALAWAPVRFTATAAAGRTALAVAPLRARALRLVVEGPAAVAGIDLFAPAETLVVRVTDFRVEAGENEATVRWRTSFPVTTEILYGYDPSALGPGPSHSPERRTDHAVHLPALLPGTEYSVWVLVGPNEAVGAGRNAPFTFTTKGRPYPRVVATEVLERAPRRLRLRFRTNVPTRARLAWGERVDAVLRSDRRGLVHDFTVEEGLAPRTRYVYHVVLEDEEGRKTTMPAAEISTAEANAALGRGVEGTFTARTEAQAAGPTLPRAVDGRLDYFEGMATSGDPAETDQWLRVDLGAPKDLEEVEVVWRANACPRAFFVVLGASPEEVRYPGGPFDSLDGEVDRSERGDPLRVVRVPVPPDFGPVRYVAVFVPKGSPIEVKSPGWRWIQLAEVKAHLRLGGADRSASAERDHTIGGVK